MDNQEILDRFDALYNNIMSDRAPGLDAKEISIFFNKAQLEELKNKLNPKGNKYAEGFDFSSKRQVEFSNLIVQKEFNVKESTLRNTYSNKYWTPYYQIENIQSDDESLQSISTDDVEFRLKDNILCIINERIDTLSNVDIEAIDYYNSIFSKEIQKMDRPNVSVVTSFIAWMINHNIKEEHPLRQYCIDLNREIIDIIMNSSSTDDATQRWNAIKNANSIFESIDEAITHLNLQSCVESKIIVPINNVEYDTLMSRPYKYPPKSQIWRLIISDIPYMIVGPNEQPIHYRIRYIRVPREVDLSYTDTTADDYSKHCCELPDFLIDEVLQRAVELAKNAWEGTVETTKAFGERSE